MMLLALLLLQDDPVRDYALVVGGTSYTAQQEKWYWESSSGMVRILREKYGYPDEAVFFLYAKPDRDAIVDGRATRANVLSVLDHLARVTKKNDRLFVFMVGHTAAKGEHSYYDTVGEKLQDADFAKKLNALPDVEVTLVMSPCQAEGFLRQCSSPGRVILVSTRMHEYNAAGVAEAFLRGIEQPKWDLDGDGRNSLWEAYQAMVDEQKTWWAARGKEPEEHALLDDDGDGQGQHRPERGDGDLARRRFLGAEGRALRVSDDARARLRKLNDALQLD